VTFHPDAVLIAVVDVQEKLLPAMPDAPGLIRDAGFILDVARLFQLPILATEQYPQGLGPTTRVIAEKLTTPAWAKTSFSAWDCPAFRDALRESQRTTVILVGMETHVCIRRSARDLLDEGYRVIIPRDAVQARHAIDHDTAIEELRIAGAAITTAETLAFACVDGAEDRRFKELSRLIKNRFNPA
jgi:nicotinamidase-related amidase